jgi:hypothetical protein
MVPPDASRCSGDDDRPIEVGTQRVAQGRQVIGPRQKVRRQRRHADQLTEHRRRLAQDTDQLVEVARVLREEQNGKRVKRTFLRHVNEQVDDQVSLRGARVYDSKGRRLGQAAAFERLSAGGMFLKSADGNKVNARYLRAIREDLLILVLPVVEPVLIAEENLPKGK